MSQMQSGEVVNFIHGFPSENRPALHTATRDFFESPNEAPEATSARELARNEVEKLRTFIAKIDEENQFTDMIVIGIGGSELGPKAAYEAMQAYSKGIRRVHFIGNIDPDCLGITLKRVNLSKTLVLVISKTGTTLETVTNEEALRAQYKALNLDSREHFISITTPNSPLDDLHQYFETFHFWDFIGGRYSVTSMVGGVLLAFAYGFSLFWEFLRGLMLWIKPPLIKI